MRLAWNYWLFSCIVTLDTRTAHWNPLWCSSHTYFCSSCTLSALKCLLWNNFFLNITLSSSYLLNCLSISANYSKQVCSNVHTSKNYLETTLYLLPRCFSSTVETKALLWWITALRSQSMTNILCHLMIWDV